MDENPYKSPGAPRELAVGFHWRFPVGVVLCLAATIPGLLAAVMAIESVWWLILETLDGFAYRVTPAILSRTVVFAASAAIPVWIARRINRGRGPPSRR